MTGAANTARLVLLIGGCGLLAGCRGSSAPPDPPPDPQIHPGGQLVPTVAQHNLATLLKDSRPRAPVVIGATLPLKAPLANRSLVLASYRALPGDCLVYVYLSMPGSLDYGGHGFTVGPCQPHGCGICVTRPLKNERPNAFVALVTDWADTLRITFAQNLGADSPEVYSHDYALNGPHVGAPGQRAFMLDPPGDTIVLRLDALRNGSVVSSQTLAGLV